MRRTVFSGAKLDRERDKIRAWLDSFEEPERLQKFDLLRSEAGEIAASTLAAFLNGDGVPSRGRSTLEAIVRASEKLIPTGERILIPDQNPLFRFGLSGDRISLLQPDPEGSDFDAMAALRDEMLASLDDLRAIYAKKPNRPQVDLIAPAVARYYDEMSKELEEINPVTLYARGSRLISQSRRANAMIERGDWPENEPGESGAIDTVTDLHGAFLMQTAAGRKIVTDARDFQNTPEQDTEEQQLIADIGHVVSSEPGLHR